MFAVVSRFQVVIAFVISCVLLVSVNVQAASTVELYSESVVVSHNAAQKELNEATRKAFRRLMVRVTGYEDVLNESAIIEASEQGNRYLAASYFAPSDVTFTNVLGEAVATKTLLLEFDKKSVDALLVQNRLPVWGAKRPDVLIWLADRFNGGENILSDTEQSELTELIYKYSLVRGIPYMLPIMDLEDSLALSFADIYGLFSTDIETASERYSPDAILTGRMFGTGDKVQADWMFLFKGERLRLPTVVGTKEQVIAKGMDLVAQRLSEQYALILDPSLIGVVSIKVPGIVDLNEFSALEDYLQSINVITQVTIRQLSGETVSVDLELSGDSAQLNDILQLDNVLAPVIEASLIDQLDNEALYQWAGQ